MSSKRLLALLGAVAIFAAACGGSTATSPADQGSQAPGASPAAGGDLADEQILRLYYSSEDPHSLDPAIAETSTDIQIVRALSRPLLYFDKDLNIVPELATALPEISDDELTYTYTLRDAQYSNGDTIVADDLVYAWKRLIDPRTGSTYQSIISDVDGGQEILELPEDASDADIQAAVDAFGVSAPDDKTFVVKFDHKTGYGPDLATLWGTAPYQEKWITSPDALEAGNYVSSGPFQLQTFEHQSEIVLAPNPNWYGDVKPTLQEVRFHIGGDPASSQASFEAGEYDIVSTPPEQYPRVKDDPELGPLLQQVPSTTMDYWGFDTTKGPTANRHFRRALSMAIDKEALLATAYGGVGTVAGSPMPPGVPGHQPDIGLPYDVEAAKAELATALTELGYSDVSEVPVLSFGFNTEAGHDVPAAFMQEQWATNLGVQSELKGVTFDQFVVERPQLVYSIARNAWGMDYPHPDSVMRSLFHSKSGSNDEGYSNPDFDKLIEEAGAKLDINEAIPLYNQAQEMLVEDAPAVFTRWRVENYEVQPWVTGYGPTALDSEILGDQRFEDFKMLKH